MLGSLLKDDVCPSKLGTFVWKTGSPNKATCQHWIIPHGHTFAEKWLGQEKRQICLRYLSFFTH